jgi:hypothetical protein
MSDRVDVAPASEFPPGTWRSVDLEGSPVAVFNLDREYYESRMCARMTAASSPAARWSATKSCVLATGRTFPSRPVRH